jgi:hypothetical protein
LHWPLWRPRLLARTGHGAELGAGPEIDYSKTTSSCFTSPPTPKALPLPPQNRVSCVLKPQLPHCPVCLTSRLLGSRGRPSIRFIFSEQTSNSRWPISFALRFILYYSHRAGPFREPYSSHSICKTRVAAHHVPQPSRCHATASVAVGRARDLLIRPGRSAKPAARQHRRAAASRQP